MGYAYHPQQRSSSYRGMVIVVALHVLLAWALISGTAREAPENLMRPLQAVVIQEVFIPPPPPPPMKIKPPQAKAPRVSGPTAPPQATPPEVPAPATDTIVIAAPAAPTPSVNAPSAAPAPPAPVVAAATATPAPAPAIAKAPARPDVGVGCPVQVKPQYPRRQLQDGVEGVIKVQALVRGGLVQEVTFLSGSRVFLPAVRSAMLQYRCSAEPAEYLVTQEFPFRIRD